MTPDELLKDLSIDSNTIYLFPREIDTIDGEEVYIYENETDNVLKILAAEGIECELVTEEENKSIAVERDAHVGIPVILIAYALYRENRDIIKTAFEKIADYYIARATREVEIGIKQENEVGELQDFYYKGHPNDLPDLLSRIDEEFEEND